jgi:hypothetical protein
MQRRLTGLLGVLAVAGAVPACIQDPLADLDASPAAIITSFSTIQLNPGQSATFTASVVDGRNVPLVTPVTFSACDAAVTAVDDASYDPVPAGTSYRALVTAVSQGPSCVNVSGGGLPTKQVVVNVLPSAFDGTISSLTPAGGSEITIDGTADLSFDPAQVTVTFGGGVAGLLTSVTATQIKVLVPFGPAGPLTITGVDVNYVPGLVVTLSTAATVTQTGDAYSGDDAFATAPTISVPAAAGAQTFLLTNFAGSNTTQCSEYFIPAPFTSAGVCVIYKFVVPAGETRDLTVVADWDSAEDIDIYTCSVADPANDCFDEGGGGATGAQPEDFGPYTFTAGTWYFVIENYSGGATSNVTVTFTHN